LAILAKRHDYGMRHGIAVAVLVIAGLGAFAGSAKAESGIASVYDYPQAVACGGRYDRNALTAAHKTHACNTKVRVTNKSNGRSVVVTINDRGPFVRGRIIDLSYAASKAIGMPFGLAPVTIEVMP